MQFKVFHIKIQVQLYFIYVSTIHNNVEVKTRRLELIHVIVMFYPVFLYFFMYFI